MMRGQITQTFRDFWNHVRGVSALPAYAGNNRWNCEELCQFRQSANSRFQTFERVRSAQFDDAGLKVSEKDYGVTSTDSGLGIVHSNSPGQALDAAGLSTRDAIRSRTRSARKVFSSRSTRNENRVSRASMIAPAIIATTPSVPVANAIANESCAPPIPAAIRTAPTRETRVLATNPATAE